MQNEQEIYKAFVKAIKGEWKILNYALSQLLLLFVIAYVTLRQASCDLKEIGNFQQGVKHRTSHSFKILTEANCKRITVYTFIAFYTSIATILFCLIFCLIFLL